MVDYNAIWAMAKNNEMKMSSNCAPLSWELMKVEKFFI